MLQGLNKPSVKRIRKNYLPPFEDERWKVVGDTSMIRDFVKNGYEVSYNTVNSRYMGMSINLPLSLAGKTVSISVQEARGNGSAIQLSYRVAGVLTNKSIAYSNGNKLEDIAIPNGITELYFKIQNNSITSEPYYFRGLQLEEGAYATDFEEQIIDGARGMYELVPEKNISPVRNVYKTFNTTTQMGNQGGSILVSNIPVKPNTTYSLSFKGIDGLSYVVITQDKLTSNVAHNALYSEMVSGGSGKQTTVSSDNTLTFTTSANDKYVAFTTGNTQAGTFPAEISIEDIQIEEGNIITSFEPYKLVRKPIQNRLVPKKNLLLSKHSSPKYLDSTIGSSNRVTASLLDGGILNDKYYEVSISNQTLTDNYFVLHGGLQSGVFKLYKLKPNTTYTLSSYVKTDGSGVLGFIKGILFNKQGTVYSGEKQGNYIKSTSWTRSSVTFTTDDNIAGVLIRLQVPVTGLTGKVYFDGLQLEEGELTDFQPYSDVNKKASLLPKKNLLQDIDSMDTSSLWVKEVGATVVKTGEKFQGADVYRMTFQPNRNGRVIQLFNDFGTYSASLWVKFIQYDTSLVLTLREKGFGTSFGLTSINNAIYDWQRIKLENVNVTKESMFAIYKSGMSQAQEVIVDVAMPQLEKSSVATDFKPYELGNRFPASPIFKAPIKKYPFIFKRESAEVLDDISYSYNNPRIVKGGLFIEEGTTNLLHRKNLSPNSPATIEDLEDRYLVTAGTNGDYSGGYFAGMVVKGGTTYTLSAKFKESDSAKGKLEFVIEQSSTDKVRYTPIKKGDRYYITFKTSSTTDRLTVCFYMKGSKTGDSYEIWKDIQLEEKGFPTSPTEIKRESEVAKTPPIQFDKLGGSIEVDFEWELLSPYRSQYVFDTTASNRWLLYYGSTIQRMSMYMEGSGKISFDATKLITGRNKVLIKWTSTTVEIYVNSEKVGSTNIALTSNTAVEMFLGNRFSNVEHLNNVIYSLAVKDRNGLKTFSF